LPFAGEFICDFFFFSLSKGSVSRLTMKISFLTKKMTCFKLEPEGATSLPPSPDLKDAEPSIDCVVLNLVRGFPSSSVFVERDLPLLSFGPPSPFSRDDRASFFFGGPIPWRAVLPTLSFFPFVERHPPLTSIPFS